MITDLPTKHISTITEKNSTRFYLQNGGENGRHRYETKLRHCHPMYILDVTTLSIPLTFKVRQLQNSCCSIAMSQRF